MDHWFRGKLKGYTESVLVSPQMEKRGYFDSAVIRRMLTEHQTRRQDHSERLWALLMLELWHQVYIDKAYAFPWGRKSFIWSPTSVEGERKISSCKSWSDYWIESISLQDNKWSRIREERKGII